MMALVLGDIPHRYPEPVVIVQRIFTGIDLCDANDLARRLRRSPQLLRELFSPDEIAYCESCPKPALHFAARFALKEAFAKALGFDLLGLDLAQIELKRTDSGRPELAFRTEEFYTMVCERLGTQAFQFDVSVSHERDLAVASVVLLVME